MCLCVCVFSLYGLGREDSSCAKVLSTSQKESIFCTRAITIMLWRGTALQLHSSSLGLRVGNG